MTYRLKTWPPFLLKLFFSLILIVVAIGHHNLVRAQSLPPGIFETLESIVTSQRESSAAIYKDIQAKSSLIGSNDSFEDIALDKSFLRELITFSENRFLQLLNSGEECGLYALLYNGLLTSSKPDQIIAQVLLKKDDPPTAMLFPQRLFFELLFKKKCFHLLDTNKLFSITRLKNTIKEKKIISPSTKGECSLFFKSMLKDPHLPFICKIPETIKKARSLVSKNKKFSYSRIPGNEEIISNASYYTKNLDFFFRFFSDNLCENIGNEDKFCAPFLSTNIWSKAASGEVPSFKIKNKCSHFIGTPPSQADLDNCAKNFVKDPKICVDRTHDKGNALFPLADCNTTSNALSHSNFIVSQQDCPASVSNDAVTNIFRIFSHYYPKTIAKDGDCTYNVYKTVSDIYRKYDELESWPFKLCYFSKTTLSHKCLTYIPGTASKDSMAEGHVVGNATHNMTSAAPGTICQLVSEDEYKPSRLQYKAGCFIVYKKSGCQGKECNKKVIYNNVEVKNIEFRGKFNLDYFPLSFTASGKSFANLFQRYFSKKGHKIKNFTDLKQFFKDHPKDIVHGEGCLEDILPERFRKNSFNQCSASLFIISGVSDSVDSETPIYLTTHLAIDDINSPRPILWNQIFNALTSFREIHPLKSWNFYGLVDL